MAKASGAPTFLLRIGDITQISLTFTEQEETVARMVNPGGAVFEFFGSGLTYGPSGFTGGTITSIHYNTAGNYRFGFDNLSISAVQVNDDLSRSSDNWLTLQRDLFTGDDVLYGGENNDFLVGYDGNDSMSGGNGDDLLDGDEAGIGAGGDDTIDGGNGNDSIRGLNGNDLIYGGNGSGLDDINGNQGNDTLFGGEDNDTVRGGQGNDVIYGGGGSDGHLNGNVGNDTVYGGEFADALFGGQNEDVLYGDNGPDTLSGDLGNDTLIGGNGGDRFIMSATTPGDDVITDFSAVNGDVIQLPAGTTYTAATVAGSAVLTLSTGGTLTLLGITAAQIQSSWIVAG